MMHTNLAHAVRRLRAVAAPARTDRQLLERFLASRDQTAFAELVRRHGRAVLAACRQVLSDPADVDDAFQATFLVLLRRAQSVDWKPSLGRWLFVVAHRVAVHARTASRQRRVKEGHAVRVIAEMPDLSWREAVVGLHEELDRLPDSYRLPLLLCYLEGLSRDEAAQQLGWSASVLRGRLERGRAKLRQRLLRRGLAPAAGLVAMTMGRSESAGGPTPELVRLAVRAAAGGSSPTVAALARAAGSGVVTLKKAFAAVLVLAGLLGGGFGLGRPPADNREEPPAQKAETSATSESVRGMVAAPAEVEAAIVGRVIGSSGQPVPGAKMYWLSKMLDDHPLVPRTTSEADGHFRFAVRYPARSFDGQPQTAWTSGNYLVAVANGHGIGWLQTCPPGREAVVHLPADDRPLQGRVIGLEGRPIAGVTVRVVGASGNQDGKSLNEWLAATRAGRGPAPLSHLGERFVVFPVQQLFPSTVTGPDGRFVLHGIGQDRIVRLRVEGPTVAAQEVTVVTRVMERFTISWQGGGRASGMHIPREQETYFGLPATIVAGPGVAVVGTVKDTDTGRPVPGVMLKWTVLSPGGMSLFMARAVSGPDGRYRLNGLPRAKPGTLLAQLTVVPSENVPYHQTQVPVHAAEGPGPIALDVPVKRGVLVNVKVRDKATGAPVPVMRRYAVFADNPNVPRSPPYVYLFPEYIALRADFRVVVFPGPGMLAVAANGWGYVSLSQMAYLSGVGAEQFAKWRQGDQLLGSQPIGNTFIREWNTFVKVSPTLGQKSLDVTVYLDPGLSADVRALGPDGKELTGTVAFGLVQAPWRCWTRQPAETAHHTVHALRPGEARRVIVAHPDKKLIGTAIITGGRGPVAVTLRPWASVTGRVVDAAGKPLHTGNVGLGYEMNRTDDIDFGAVAGLESGSSVDLDSNGRFTIAGLVPGLKYRFYADAAGKKSGNVPEFVAAGPGRVTDVGDVRLETEDR